MKYLGLAYVVAVAAVCTVLAFIVLAVLRGARFVTVDVPSWVGTVLARRRLPTPPQVAAGDPRCKCWPGQTCDAPDHPDPLRAIVARDDELAHLDRGDEA